MINQFFGGRDALHRIGSQILILGEGNFSLTLALCKAKLKYPVFDNLWSTTLDNKSEKYNQSIHNTEIANNIAEIQKCSRADILYEIDCTKLPASADLKRSFKSCHSRKLINPHTCEPCLGIRIEQPVFDVIFFTFPIHYPLVGVVKQNKHFLLDFFASATSILRENGEIRITLQSQQFKQWNVKTSAEHCGLKPSLSSECHWENLFVPDDGYGFKWIPHGPMWHTFVKV
jgi:hypothetical protein